MSETPDYNLHSDQELVDIYDETDKSSKEEIFQALCEVMAERGLLFKTFDRGYEFNDKGYYLSEESKVKEEPTYTEKPPEPNYDEEGNYIPNQIPKSSRIFNTIVAVLITSYGGYGIWVNELWIPWVRRHSVTLSGFPALLMFMAILCAVTVLVIEIIDHYDKRENERTYYKAALIFQYLGIALFVIAYLSGLVSNAINEAV
jgi:hypothetical protein